MKESIDLVKIGLEAALNKVNWAIVNHGVGCEHYVLYNDKKEYTSIEYTNRTLVFKGDAFGSGKSKYDGSVTFYLDKCSIAIDNEVLYISSGGATISFYDFGKKERRADRIQGQ